MMMCCWVERREASKRERVGKEARDGQGMGACVRARDGVVCGFLGLGLGYALRQVILH